MKRVLIFHNLKQYKNYYALKKELDENFLNQIIVLVLDLRIFLQKKKIQHKVLDEYILSDKIADELDHRAFNLAENWHKDLFKFKGISLGRLFQWDMKYYFARIIRNLQIILTIISIESPDEIITFKDNDHFIQEFNQILNHVCLLKNISIDFIQLTTLSENSYQFKFSMKDLIKKFSSLFLSLVPIKKILKIFLNLLTSLKNSSTGFKNKKMNKILMVGGYTYPTLVDKVSKNNIVISLYPIRTLLLTIKSVKNIFKRKSASFIAFLEDYIDHKINEQSNLFIKKSSNEWKKKIKTIKSQEIFIFNGISIWTLIKKKINELIFIDFKWAVQIILAFYKFLKKNHFDLITLNVDTMKFQKTLVFVASKLNISTMVIQHGLAGSQNQINSKIYTIGFIPLSVDKIALWGKTAKDWFIHHGISEERLIVTGAPRFDKYIKMNRNKSFKLKIKNSIYQHFGINRDKNLILFTPNNQDFNIRFTSLHLTLLETEKIYTCVLNAMNELPNSHLIIKLHPNDQYEYISNMLIKNLGIKNVSVVRKYTLENLLMACDCQITTWSTTGLEGLLFGNPLICIKFRNKKYDVPYIEYNVAYKVSKCQDLSSTIKKVLNNPDALKINYKKFIEDYNYKTDGLATKRVTKLVENLCKKN